MDIFDFGKDKRKDKRKEIEETAKKEREAKRKELKEIIKGFELNLPKERKITAKAKEYEEFLKETKETPLNLYEKTCAFTEKILPVKFPNSITADIEENAKAGYLNVKGNGVLSLTILVFLCFFLLSSLLIIWSVSLGIFCFVFTFVITYVLFNYPSAHAKAVVMRMSADSVLAILYMIIYMRMSPNMEGAVKFAANNLYGPLSWDLKKLLWDINLGVYESADAAIGGYSDKWKKKNKEFSEALNILRSSAVREAKRKKLFDEAIDIILRGTADSTKSYIIGLRMPVMLIHAMGVLLPVMGLVMFPIMVILMSDVINPYHLFFGYDVLLPLFLWIFIDYILKGKPPTFSQPDISLAKDVPGFGKMRIGSKIYPIWPFTLIVSAPLVVIGILGVLKNSVYSSVVLIAGVVSGIIIYCLLDSWQKMKIRNDIESIEDEFSVALFQLGNSITSGTPIEASLDKAIDNLRGLKIAELVKITNNNMKSFGYTFEEALFDNKIGAVWVFPSKLVRSIMTTIIESGKKSMEIASESMITISKYLRGVRNVKRSVEDILGETITSMKFLAMILTPLVAGITITMAIIIIDILTTLTEELKSTLLTGAESGGMSNMFVVPWLMGGGIPITAAVFQLIVGIYMVETVIILSVFVNKIEYGEDEIGMRSSLGTTLLVAFFIYVLSWLISYLIFGNAIGNILIPRTG